MNLQTAKGVNVFDKLLMSRSDGTSLLIGSPPSWDARFKDIAAHGFNLVRVPFNLEAFDYNSAGCIAALKSIAESAAVYGISVIFDNQQTNASSAYGGNGFSPSLCKGLSTQEEFWSEFYTDMTKWASVANTLKQIIAAVDSYSNVIGYDIQNEPYIYSLNQYRLLGQYHTYLANHVRQISSKIIFFDKAEPQYSGSSYVNFSYDPLTKPSAQNIVFAPHEYAAGSPSHCPDYLTLAKNWNVPLIIGEWGVSNSSASACAYLDYFKQNNLGWIRWAYDPIDPTYNLNDVNWQETQNYIDLINAMATA